MEVSAKKARSPPHLPIEMIRCILMKLKLKALIRSQCVCKEWRSIIQDPNFKLSCRGRRRLLVAASGRRSFAVKSISNNLRIKTLFQGGDNHPFFNIFQYYGWSGVWCTCNGLVLFSVGKHILLWNPSTRCCTKVLEHPLLLWRHHNVLSGLCYVPSTRDYKVVLLFRPDGTGTRTNVLVASLKDKEWRQVLFPYHAMSVRDGINFHNTLHWRVGDSSRDWYISRRCKKVVYFEAERDEFKELPTPTFPVESCAIRGLGIIDGRLSLARERGTGEVEVLVMKEYGVKKSWVSQFVISASELRSDHHRDFTFCSSKDYTKVLISSCLYGWWGTLVYDLKNNELEKCLEEPGYQIVAICSYAESFVSPHEFIWRDDDQHEPHPYENDDGLRFILERFNI